MAYVAAGEFMMGCYEAPGNCNPDNEYLHYIYLEYHLNKLGKTKRN